MIACLEVHSWAGIVAGASHYHGNIKIGKESIKVSRKLSKKEALGLNRDAKRLGSTDFIWEPGDECCQFESEEALHKAAIALIQRENPRNYPHDSRKFLHFGPSAGAFWPGAAEDSTQRAL